MPSLPRITIITPSFNQAQYLAETIESILSQQYDNLQYVIIDGGSTDESVEIIRGYEDKVDCWISEKDKGQTDAIMKGLNRCTGELFAWVNSDDVLFPGCLKTIAECYIEKKPEIIHSNIAYINSSSEITGLVRVPRQSNFFLNHGVIHMTAPCVFFKTSFLNRVGGLNPKYHLSMDVDIWVRMIKAGGHVKHIAKYLGGFRWHETSKTVQSKKSRTSVENAETTQILNTSLTNSTPSSRAFWRRVYNCYQIMNLNYLRNFIDFNRLTGSRHWQKFK